MKRVRSRWIAVSTGAAFSVAVALAEGPTTPSPAPSQTASPPTAAAAAGIPANEGGLVAARAADGTWRTPTAEDLARLGLLVDPLNQSDEGLVQVFHPNGAVSLHLQGRYMEHSLLRRDPASGESQALCSSSPQTVLAFLTAPAVAPLGTVRVAPIAEVRDDR